MNSKELIDNIIYDVNNNNDIDIPDVDDRLLNMDKLSLLKVIDALIIKNLSEQP